MTTSIVSKHSRGALALAASLVAAGILSACGGGGVTPSASTSSSSSTSSSGGSSSSSSSGGGGTGVTPTAYTLYASNYVIYPTQTDGSYLHSIQGGNVYTGFGGNLNYGCYSSSQANITATQFYALQVQADSDGGASSNGQTCKVTGTTAPTAATDSAGIAIQSPGSAVAVAASNPLPTFDISQSTSMLIQMGNIYTKGDIGGPGDIGGNATTYTITLGNDTSLAQTGVAPAAFCYASQLLGTVGRGQAAPLGMLNYEIPLSSFTNCTNGATIATLQATGITTVRVSFTGDANPNMVVGEYDVIAIGYIGFTK